MWNSEIRVEVFRAASRPSAIGSAVFAPGYSRSSRHPFLRGELKSIEHALRNRRTILGVCFGSHLLAAALGVAVKKEACKEIGWHPVWLSGEAQRDFCDHFTARRSAARASKRVESSTGKVEFESFTINGISVQPSMTASHPSCFIRLISR